MRYGNIVLLEKKKIKGEQESGISKFVLIFVVAQPAFYNHRNPEHPCSPCIRSEKKTIAHFLWWIKRPLCMQITKKILLS